LRERKDDIAPLTFFYLQFFCNKYSRMKVLSQDALNAMLSYEWPGNVRELRNFIERIVVTLPDTDIQIEAVPNRFLQGSSGGSSPIIPIPQADQTSLPPSFENGFSHRAYMERCEKQLIQSALAQFKTPAKAAEALNLDLSNVYRKMRKYHIFLYQD
jgi:DNA-binding NtrC family response regulator